MSKHKDHYMNYQIIFPGIKIGLVMRKALKLYNKTIYKNTLLIMLMK